MSSNAKKTYCKKAIKHSESSDRQNESEKENMYMKLRKRNKPNYKDTLSYESQSSDSDVRFEKLRSSPLKQEVNLKPLSFWSKKLQDLDSQKNISKKKKCGLYEFSGTDESFPEATRKKKQQRKAGGQKRKCKTEFKCKSDKPKSGKSKINKVPQTSFVRERVLLSRETEKLDDKDKFTFTAMSVGVTSTPAPNKINLVEASNFMFLSPVKKEGEPECFNDDDEQHITLKSNLNTSCNSMSKTPKKQTRLNKIISKRVLRKRKIVSSN